MALKSPEQILKDLAIEKWRKGGLERPVKVVAASRGALSKVRGYITQEKNIKGQSLKEIETRLGLPSGDLAAGADVMVLNRLPRVHEFELRSYTNLPGGQRYVPGTKYPPGTGVPQWELIADIPSTPLKFVQPGQTYRMKRVPVTDRCSMPAPSAPTSIRHRMARQLFGYSGHPRDSPAKCKLEPFPRGESATRGPQA